MNTMDKKALVKILALFLSFPCLAQENGLLRDSLGGRNPKTDSTLPAFVEIAPNPELKGNGLKRFLIGKNYRKEWTEPVRVPVLDFRTEAGGLTVKKEGGGKETRSLQVEDSSGHSWSLRSIRKYPEKAIPAELKKTVAEELVADDISASYPYGALSMGVLSRAAGVPYLKDKLTYIGDDPALGEFRSKYKNSLVLMEDKEPEETRSKNKDEKSIGTQELVYKLAANKNGDKVDQKAVLRARLLDNFVMDFDRHEGQWTWLSFDSAGRIFYYPVPKDRDQVFYTNQGLIPKLISSKERLPELQGFRAEVKHISTFNRTARNFDRSFLNELSADDWSKETDAFINAMTDDVIETALRQQPKEIQSYAVEGIIRKLKKKRKSFKEDIMRYYHSLSGAVAIVGSNEKEEFSIAAKEDGNVLVVVSKLDSLGNPSSESYRRLFDPSETKEIDLYGLENDDRFMASGGKSKIRIRMVGGPGNDRFIRESGSGKLIAYDVDFENNTVGKGIRNRISGDPLNNTYTRLGHNDNVVSAGPAIELSAVEGWLAGLKLKAIGRGFRKDPYSARHLFIVSHSLNSSSFHFRWESDFMKLSGRTDLLIRGDMMAPTNKTNFFGFGNKTLIDESQHDDVKFYHARYDFGNFSLFARTSLRPWLTFEYGPSFQYLKLRRKENESKYVAQYFNPADQNIYHAKSYGGGIFRLGIDARNNPLIPTRGIVLNASARPLFGLNGYSSDVTLTSGNISFYTDFLAKNKIVLATSFGGGHNFGGFELGQSQFLGFTEHLRGFRPQRFAGRTAAYNNTELRIKLSDINVWLFPATFGIYGFNDVGRVWIDGEDSKTWHHGYGGGVWLAPFKRMVITGYVSFSKEEKALPWATIGFIF
jgi:hypothetical protein